MVCINFLLVYLSLRRSKFAIEIFTKVSLRKRFRFWWRIRERGEKKPMYESWNSSYYIALRGNPPSTIPVSWEVIEVRRRRRRDSAAASFNESAIFPSYHVLGNKVCNLVSERGITIVRDRPLSFVHFFEHRRADERKCARTRTVKRFDARGKNI